MTYVQLNKEYFGWLQKLVCDTRYSKSLSYRKLLTHLHEIEFTYVNEMDGNRASDGIDLRYRFAYYKNYDWREVASCIDDKPCSVLEMLVALSVRCEEHIMDDPDIGNRTGQWFWNMIVNLGLGSMTDAKFDAAHVEDIIARFLNREYARNGEGGLFTVHNPKYNMQTAEIWWQMMWYLKEVLE